MTKLTKSGYMILGLLSKSDYSGYQLKKIMAKVATFFWSESNAQIYPVLKKLETAGLVSSKLDETSGARNTRIFSITKQGMAELMTWLEADCDLTLYREEFLLQMSLSQHLNKARLLEKLESYKQSVKAKLKKHQEVVNHIEIDHANKPDREYLLLTYEHIKMILEAKLAWCDKVIKSLK